MPKRKENPVKEKDSEAVSGEAEMDPQQKEAAPAKGKKKATKKKDEEEDDVVDEGEDAGGDDKVDDGTPKKRGRTAAKPKAAASAASKKGSKKKDKSGDDEASQKDGETKKNEVPVMTELPKGSLKILSWNVGGFRAAIRKGALEYLESHQSDILFINETKGTEEDFKDASARLKKMGYDVKWNQCTQKGGYSGTCICVKPETAPLRSVSFDFTSATKGGLKDAVVGEGRVITAEFDEFYLVGAYVPNSGQKLERLKFRTETWDPAFLAHLNALQKTKPLILTGDLNVAHLDIDCHSPATNKRTAGFTQEERKNFKELIDGGYIDVFRRINGQDAKGYTYWSNRFDCKNKDKGWRLDYFLCSPALADKVAGMVVGSEVSETSKERMSDHAPIFLSLK